MKETLGDKVIKAWKNYIAPTKQDVKKGKKEERLVAGDPEFPETRDNPYTKELTVIRCITVAEQCPLFMKGARKKAKDSIRAWHRIEHIDKTQKVRKVDLEYIRNFTQRNNLKKLWETLRVASYTTGDGYLLITFDGDKTEKLEDKPTKGSYPYKVRIIPSEYITEIGFNPNKPEHVEKLVKSFHYVDNKSLRDEWIYPDRILHLTNDQLFGNFGHSKVNLLRNIIKSNVNIDIAVGEILAWFAHGMLDIKQVGCNANEIKKWTETVNQHPGAYIHDDDAELKFISPQAIDPKPFYEYLVLSIAAAFYMPTHILTGIQVGKVTGAEVGTGDYVKDLKDDQELDFNPLLEHLYKMILEGKKRSWDKYEIVWNPIYIDELSEADILGKKVQAADLAYNGNRGSGGFIDKEEARRVFNDGQIVLDANKDIKTKEPPKPVAAPPKPGNDESKEDSIIKPTNKAKAAMEKYGIEPDPYKIQLDIATQAMIEKRKIQWARERRLAKQNEDGRNTD